METIAHRGGHIAQLGCAVGWIARAATRPSVRPAGPRWPFKTLHTLRQLRAGRLTRPEGKLTLTKLTLTMSGNREVRDGVLHYLRAAHAA